VQTSVVQVIRLKRSSWKWTINIYALCALEVPNAPGT
jgi:hypothetical protein